jgi:tRNA (guanine9-N1)-methyltransferase
LCRDKAVEGGVRIARLPIGKYMADMPTRKVLTVNQVFEILLRWLETRDWKEALYAVMPKRKFIAGKGRKTGDGKTESAGDEEGAEDEGGQEHGVTELQNEDEVMSAMEVQSNPEAEKPSEVGNTQQEIKMQDRDASALNSVA